MNVLDYLKQCTILVWPEKYSVIKAKSIEPNCFATIIDKAEITLVQQSSLVRADNIIEEEKEWRILTFEAVLPFELTGFLAIISKVLADENIPIFALSAFSTDHIMIKDQYLAKALDAFKKLGVGL